MNIFIYDTCLFFLVNAYWIFFCKYVIDDLSEIILQCILDEL